MARKRMVSPDLLTSEKVATMPVASRYAWVGLWLYLDDFGYGKDNSSLIKAHTWPLDDAFTPKKVETDLCRYWDLGLLCRYQTLDGSLWMHAPSWGEHQKVQHATPTKAPPCPFHSREAHELFWTDSEFIVSEWRVTTEQLRHRLVQFNLDKSSSMDLGSDQHEPLRGIALARDALRSVSSA